MNTSVRINKMACEIDYQAFSEKYDVFCLETCEKYINRGSYLLDASSLCNDVKSIKFETGKKVFFLMYKDAANKNKLKNLIKQLEDGDKYSIQAVQAREVKDCILIQLLFNALGSYDSEFLKYNNLTGHLYCFHPNWIKRGNDHSESVIWKIPCLEVTVTNDLCLRLFVRTFTSERLKGKITFKKRKIEVYPKYIFAANNTLRRKLKDDKADSFILRQVDGTKSEIPFLNIQSKEKFEQTKMGTLNEVVMSFNQRYEGICKLGFQERVATSREDYSKALQRENITRIRGVLDETKIHVVDQIQDDYSAVFCENIKKLMISKYGIEPTTGNRVAKEALNIIVIHNAEYYQGVKDPHDQRHEGIAVQHITFEDFYNCSEFAIATVVHEIIIKKDLQDKKITMFNWESLGLTESVSFGMAQEIDGIERYFFMTVNPDGSFIIKEQELNLFEYNEYAELVDLFVDAKTKSENVKGVIRFSDGRINTIKDTGIFTIPEIEKIADRLADGDNKLRGKERREELLSSCLDIKAYEEDGAIYYFVGTIGEGMRQAIPRAALIRKIESYHGAPVLFENILNTMNVSFVINGQLTVIPFPFKYLREYVNTYAS